MKTGLAHCQLLFYEYSQLTPLVPNWHAAKFLWVFNVVNFANFRLFVKTFQ